jgi:cell division protein FtsI/penicillin-binding protein 2
MTYSLMTRLAAVIAVAALAGGCGGHPDRDAARRSAVAFAQAWSAGDDARAARLTSAPSAASAALKASRAGLDGSSLRAAVGRVDADGARATADLALTWSIPSFGRFAYHVKIALQRSGAAWRIAWAPSAIYPSLRRGQRLGTVADTPARAPILDRAGHAIVRERSVVRVGLQRDKLTDADLEASARALAQAAGIDAGAYVRAVRGAGPRQFVEAVTLRAGDARGLGGMPGLMRVPGRQPLTPTRAYARALIGAVAPATADQIARSHGRLHAGDEVGQWGLQQRFDAQLAGHPSRRVVIRDAAGTPLRTVRRAPGAAARALTLTLSDAAQRAAEAALGDDQAPAAIVAVQPSTGDILAVADRPLDSTFDRALAGRYPPGSTFKVITTDALLRAGVTPGTGVPCPRTLTLDGRSFHNFEGEGQGEGATLADDFAVSCNTAFISLADRLSRDALSRTARSFGLSRSSVPRAGDAVERAAAMIGQARILASPLAMAGVAATVADGRWRRPRLLASDPHDAGPELPAGERSTLHALMRDVVTRGSATVLANIPGVAGKTGTAEYGSGDPPPTHAWFIGFRGDLALAVLVEHGSSGGAVAAPLAKRFFDAYDSQTRLSRSS